MSAQPQADTSWVPADARPGAPALRILPIPRTDPLPCPAPVPQPDEDYVQGTLAVDFRREHDDTYFGPQATGFPDLPEPEQWARRMIQVTLEVVDGLRHPDQLTRWVTPDIHQRLARRGQLARRRHQRQRHATGVRALLLCCPADGVAEVSAVITHHGRVRALALRLAGVDGRWLITAFEIG